MMCIRTLRLRREVSCLLDCVYVYIVWCWRCVCMPCVYLLIRQVEGYLVRGALNTWGGCVCKRSLNPLHKLRVYVCRKLYLDNKTAFQNWVRGFETL
jgi:hypothetical protein